MSDDLDVRGEMQRARARREQRDRDERITRRAHRALREVGWDAKAPALAAYLADDGLSYDADERAAVLARALEMQTDPQYAGRKIRPEDYTMARQILAPERRAEIREWVRAMRAANPELRAAELFPEMCRRFRVKMTKPNFYQSYWTKAAPVANGNDKPAPPPEPAPLPPAAAKVPTPVEAPTPPAAESAPPPTTPATPPPAKPATETPVVTPMLLMQQLAGGDVRVRMDLITDLRGAALLAHHIGAALVSAGGSR